MHEHVRNELIGRKRRRKKTMQAQKTGKVYAQKVSKQQKNYINNE